MRENWIVAVTAGRWQQHSIRQAKHAGVKVFAIDSDPVAPGFCDADQHLCCDISDIKMILQTLRTLDVQPQGVTTFTSEAGMQAAAALRDALGLNGINSQNILLYINKAFQRKKWDSCAVPGPCWRVANSKQEFFAATDDVGFPCIVKPVDGSGSRGVTKISSKSEVTGAIYDYSRMHSKIAQVIVEEYMEGIEFTAEVFAYKGDVEIFAITRKDKVEGTNNTVASGLTSVSSSSGQFDEMCAFVINAFEALGFESGAGHAEFIWRKQGGFGMVEVAARGGGFLVFDKLVPRISGIDIAMIEALNTSGFDLDWCNIKKSKKTAPLFCGFFQL